MIMWMKPVLREKTGILPPAFLIKTCNIHKIFENQFSLLMIMAVETPPPPQIEAAK